MNAKCAKCGKPLPPRSVAQNPDESVYCRACAMKMLEGHNTSRTETRVAIQTELQSESMADVYGPGSTPQTTITNGPRWVRLPHDRRRRRRVYSTGRKMAGAGIFLGTAIYGTIILMLAFGRATPHPSQPALAHVTHNSPSETVKPSSPSRAVVMPAPKVETKEETPPKTSDEPAADVRNESIAVAPKASETPAVSPPSDTPAQAPAPKPAPAPTPPVAVAPAPVPPPPSVPTYTPPAPVRPSTPPAPATPGIRKATALLTKPDDVGGGDIKLSTSAGTIDNITPGAWAKWDNVDFGGKGSLGSAKLMMRMKSSDHKMDIRLDDPETGPVIATLRTDNPGSDFKAITASIDEVSGKHTVYLIFDGFDSGEVQSLTFQSGAIASNAKPVVLFGPRLNGQWPAKVIKIADGAISATKPNAWVRFDKVDFGTAPGYRSILLGVRAGAPNQKLTIKLDDAAKGRTLATVNIPTDVKPGPISVAVSGAGVSGTHNVFVIFSGTDTTLQTVTFRP